MSDWVDFAVYAAATLTIWFIVPSAHARLALAMLAERNAEWCSAHPEAAARLSRGTWLLWSHYAWGMLTLVVLLLFQSGAWPAALTPPEPHRWMTLWDLHATMLVAGLAGTAVCIAVLTRRIQRVVPLAAQREASLQPRSLDDFVPAAVQRVVYALIVAHLGAWVVVGAGGFSTVPGFWWRVGGQVALAGLALSFLRLAISRRPHALDRAFGSRFRAGEVRFGFAAQLGPIANGVVRLYEEIAGVTPDEVNRAMHLGVLVLIIAFALRMTRAITARSRTTSSSARPLLAALVAAVLLPGTAFSQAPAPLTDAQVRDILAARVDTHRQSVGIVVGIVDESGRRVIAHGHRVANGNEPLDGRSVFELGSITKTFTSLLLVEAVRRGEVALSDPAAKYVPPGVRLPERGGRSITLLDLATHTSGLPREPDNVRPKDPANPYGDYSLEQFHAFLSGHTLSRDIGSQFEYSNVGAALLGQVLARRAGTDYETLMRTRIADPLGMNDTRATLTGAMRARLASGHNRVFEPVPSWDSPTIIGAGGLRSTADDMLNLLSAVLGHSRSPLADGFALMTATRRPGAAPTMQIGLGWGILQARGTEIMFANGRTGGYRTWLGYEPRTRRGVVVLTNTDGASEPDDIGFHVLNPSFPLRQSFPTWTRRLETKIDPALVDRYVGRYQFAPAVLMTISRDGSRFFAQLTGQPLVEIFAESESAFFMKAVDAQLTFETGSDGRAIALVLRQAGVGEQRAPRLEGAPAVPKEVAVDPAILDRYVGRYQADANLVMTITRREGQLMVQFPRQAPVEIFASSELQFFFKVANVQLTFEVNAQGRATAVTVRQGGVDQRAVRLD